MKFIIYRFTNKVNNKQYIGMTTQTLKRRVYLHWWVASNNPKCHFHRALIMYGKDNWDVDVLFEGTAVSPEEIKEKERLFIAEHNTYQAGYNSTMGGDDFLSSDYQRELQLNRVKCGTHPFTGGAIQRETMKTRHAQGEFVGQNQKRVELGTHNFLGEKNPAKLLAQKGEHHNQRLPWLNTKTRSNPEAEKAWHMAAELYQWYKLHENRRRGGSYRAMSNAFKLNTNLSIMIRKFKEGWVPNEDPAWIDFKRKPT